MPHYENGTYFIYNNVTEFKVNLPIIYKIQHVQDNVQRSE
jgi:hypothetical protein